MTYAYIGISAALFTWLAVGAALPPNRPGEAAWAAVLGALSTFGWVCLVRMLT